MRHALPVSPPLFPGNETTPTDENAAPRLFLNGSGARESTSLTKEDRPTSPVAAGHATESRGLLGSPTVTNPRETAEAEGSDDDVGGMEDL